MCNVGERAIIPYVIKGLKYKLHDLKMFLSPYMNSQDIDQLVLIMQID